jgi:two-component system, NarL family, invasion response regulator UvrY
MVTSASGALHRAFHRLPPREPRIHSARHEDRLVVDFDLDVIRLAREGQLAELGSRDLWRLDQLLDGWLPRWRFVDNRRAAARPDLDDDPDACRSPCGARLAITNAMIRIAIADDQKVSRWALRLALAQTHDFELVGDAKIGVETTAMLQAHEPDVLVVGAALSDHAVLDLLDELRRLEDVPLVVVLASNDDPAYAARVIAAGAHAYVSQTDEPQLLIDAIRAVTRGEQIAPAGANELRAIGATDPAGVLTNRELEVMEMLARGMTNREIAAHLQISIKTIDSHRGHVMKKLSVRNNSELTRFAVKHGYVSL